MASKVKKFRRKKEDKLIAGVLSGVADYYNQDVTIVRIIWLLILGFTGFIPGVMAYLLTVMIVPYGKSSKKPK